jgi:hypothetical protein
MYKSVQRKESISLWSANTVENCKRKRRRKTEEE